MNYAEHVAHFMDLVDHAPPGVSTETVAEGPGLHAPPRALRSLATCVQCGGPFDPRVEGVLSKLSDKRGFCSGGCKREYEEGGDDDD